MEDNLENLKRVLDEYTVNPSSLNGNEIVQTLNFQFRYQLKPLYEYGIN